jgi:GNAT superfamily N-acetyltransferase
MKTLTLRPADPDRDFAQLAALFSLEGDEPTSEPGLRTDFDEHKERIFRLMVAEDERGELLGFNWATRSRSDATQANFYVIVKPGQRGHGAGSRLYDDVEAAARETGIKKLEITVRDDCPPCLSFAGQRGFGERSHLIGMTLDLASFDDRPYDGKISALRAKGFQFTSMEALGNTEEVQRRLYALNDMTASETPGSEGEHPWLSFDDFQKKVCGADWYIPAGQMVVLDTAGGDWAALSAITRFQGAEYAYNLHTGVDRRYRGRKLGQSVKVLALRFARDVLQTTTVRTTHNVKNLPMIAIDEKMGYVRTPGNYRMEKTLE